MATKQKWSYMYAYQIPSLVSYNNMAILLLRIISADLCIKKLACHVGMNSSTAQKSPEVMYIE